VYYAPSDLAFYKRASDKTNNFLKKLDKIQSFSTYPIFLQDEDSLDEYYSAGSIAQLADDKWRHYTNVCVNLGLTRFKVKIKELKESESNNSVVLGVDPSGLKFLGLGPFIAKFSSDRKVKRIENRFNTTEIEIDRMEQSRDIDKAKEYIKTKGINDKDINELIYRIESSGSSVFRYKQTINLFKQFDSSLNVALDVKVPSILTQFNISYKNQISKIAKYELDIRLLFGRVGPLTEDDKTFLEWKTGEP
jgi:hypothetical protein